MTKNFEISEPDEGSVSYPPRSLEEKITGEDIENYKDIIEEGNEVINGIPKGYDKSIQIQFLKSDKKTCRIVQLANYGLSSIVMLACGSLFYETINNPPADDLGYLNCLIGAGIGMASSLIWGSGTYFIMRKEAKKITKQINELEKELEQTSLIQSEQNQIPTQLKFGDEVYRGFMKAAYQDRINYQRDKDAKQ